MKTPLSDFVSAGFVITPKVPRLTYFSVELLPDHLVSLSSCIACFLPDAWCIEWADADSGGLPEEAQVFGLEPATFADLTSWVTERFGQSIAWPNIIRTLDVAEQLYSTFLNTRGNFKLLEIALHQSMTEIFCREAEPVQQPGYAPLGRQGVHEVLLESNRLTKGGKVLGFEPVVFNDSLSCSWLCNGLETVVADTLAIQPNEHGLIQKYDDARKCVEYISREEVGAEPGLWLPWLVIDHTENSET